MVEELDEEDERSGEAKWEERLVTWCTVRANAKVKSFAFPPDEADTTKGGVPVCMPRVILARRLTVPAPLITFEQFHRDIPYNFSELHPEIQV